MEKIIFLLPTPLFFTLAPLLIMTASLLLDQYALGMQKIALWKLILSNGLYGIVLFFVIMLILILLNHPDTKAKLGLSYPQIKAIAFTGIFFLLCLVKFGLYKILGFEAASIGRYAASCSVIATGIIYAGFIRLLSQLM